jgi:uncharacterized delta-60 repeat protein
MIKTRKLIKEMKYKKTIIFIFICYLIGCFLFIETNELYINQDAKNHRNIPPLHVSNNVDAMEWNHTWGGEGYDVGYAIGLDSSDNIYITGWTANFGGIRDDICLLKYNPTGELQWNYTWGGADYHDDAYAIGLDSSDNIYLAGETRSFGALGKDICLLKYNSMGELQWNYTWGGASNDAAYAIGLDSSDNIYLAGGTSSFGALGVDLCLLKYNPSGELQWNYTWGGANYDYANAIALDSSDNIYLVGSTQSFGALGRDVCLLKYNTMGELQWNYTWGGNGDDYGNAIGLDSSDNIYLVGSTQSFGALGRDVCLLKYNTMGELQWNYTWGGNEDDWAYAIGLDSSNNIYLAGDTKSFGALGSDICLLKYNPIGMLQWNYTWGIGGNDYVYAIGLDSSDNIYLAGEIDDAGFYTDLYIVKLDNSPPVIAINSPNPNTFIGNVAPNFNISINELFLNSTWYTLDGGITNILFSGLTGTINQTEWDEKGDGLITLKFYANNSMGMVGTSEVSFYKDTEPPTSSIFFIPHSEINIVNDSTTFTLTADDGWIDYTVPFDLSSYNDGDYLISYYTIDKIGNIEDAHTISVELIKISSEVPEIPGYNILLVLGIVSIITIMILRKRLKT